MRQHIGHRIVLRGAHRIVQRQQADRTAEPNALGLARAGRDEQSWRTEGKATDAMLGKPRAVEAECLRQLHLGDHACRTSPATSRTVPRGSPGCSRDRISSRSLRLGRCYTGSQTGNGPRRQTWTSASASPRRSDSWKLAQRAEELGFTHAWFYDTQMITADCFVAMGAAAMKTTRIRLGTGVLVPSNRIAGGHRQCLRHAERHGAGTDRFRRRHRLLGAPRHGPGRDEARRHGGIHPRRLRPAERRDAGDRRSRASAGRSVSSTPMSA